MGLFDVSDDDLKVGKLVEPSWYPLECTKVTDGLDSNGKLLTTLEFKGLSGDAQGVKFWFRVSSKGIGFAKNLMISVTGKFERGKVEISERVFVGKKVDGYVKRSVYEDQERNDLRDFAPLGTHTKGMK